MPKQVARTSEAPVSPIYSQAIRGGGLVFVSGQGPVDPVSGQVAGTSIQEHTPWFPDNPPAGQGARIPVRPGGMRLSVAVVAQA
jgi:2-iminobutanoate/2-iminopropanoate deaminase